jgi:molybdopterin-binding protein
MLKGRVTGTHDGVTVVEVAGEEIEVAGGDGLTGKVWLFVRPENVSIVAPDSEHREGMRNSFDGEITKLYDMGPFYRATVECAFVLVALVTKRSANQMGLRVGLRVSASFDSTDVHAVSRE